MIDKKKIKQNNLTSKDNQQEQNVGLILIMRGLKEKFMTREPDFYKNYIKLNLGVTEHTTIKNLEYQLVKQK